MGIFNLVLAIPLGIKYGGIGCAAATGLAMFIGNGLIMNWYYARVTGLDIVRFWREIACISLPVVVLTVAGCALDEVLPYDGRLFFVFKILVYTLAYAYITYKLSMNAEEKAKVKPWLQRLHIN